MCFLEKYHTCSFLFILGLLAAVDLFCDFPGFNRMSGKCPTRTSNIQKQPEHEILVHVLIASASSQVSDETAHLRTIGKARHNSRIE